MKPFIKYLDESVALEAVDVHKVSTNLSSMLKSLGVSFKTNTAKYQRVFGGAELQFRFIDVVIGKNKVEYLGFQVQLDGTVTADASSRAKKRKHLVSFEKVGIVNKLEDLEKSTGRFRDIVEFTVQEIKDQLS